MKVVGIEIRREVVVIQDEMGVEHESVRSDLAEYIVDYGSR